MLNQTKLTLAITGVLGLGLLGYQLTDQTNVKPVVFQQEIKTEILLPTFNDQQANQVLPQLTFLSPPENTHLDSQSKQHAQQLFSELAPYQVGESFFIKPLKNKKIILNDALEAKNLIVKSGASYFNLNQQIDLQAFKSKRDSLGNKFYKYHLTNHNIPVYGTDVVIQVNEKNEFIFMGGDGFNDTETQLETKPSLTSNEALSNVLLNLETPAKGKIHGDAELEYFYKNDNWSLAWKMTVESNSKYHLGTMHIDAHSGEMLYFVTNIHSMDRKVYSGNNDCLRQTIRPSLPGNFLFQEGNTGSNDESAQAAYDNTGQAYWFYKHYLARNSYDDKDSDMVSSVHFQFEIPDSNQGGCHQNNAFFMGTPYNQMVYGDGDGVNFITPAKALDIAGHEVTHGVTFSESNLEYKDESGAINEAISDIFGAGIEAWTDAGGSLNGNPANGFNANSDTWVGGEDAVAKNSRRHMDNPTLDGHSTDNYNDIKRGNEDNGFVHSNSGIMNLAFYLLSEGGRHPRTSVSTNAITGIGIEDALKIYYHANVNLFTSTTNFATARQYLAQSAETLYGACSAQYIALQGSYDAINVVGDWSCDTQTDNNTDNNSNDNPNNGHIGIGATASASSVYSLSYPASNAADGVYNTPWVSQTISNIYQDQWILLDLNEAQDFSQVTIHWNQNEYARNYAIYYWNNGWVQATSNNQYTAGSPTLDFNKVNSQYVAILMNGGYYGSWYSINELEVH